MSDNHSLMQQRQQLPANDGWGDAAAEAAEQTVRGVLLKFSDWRWLAGKEGTVVPDGTKLVALATAAGWERWENGKPVGHRMREPGRRLPDRDELGYTDQSKWEEVPEGVLKDPWANTRWVSLVDPQTAEAYTFSTSSWGGRNAVAALGDQIARMRSVHTDAVPVIELRSAEMPTKFGRKSKPIFKVIGWKTASGGSGPASVERQITAQEAKQEVTAKQMDDEIPF
jgi:hypothetical protein